MADFFLTNLIEYVIILPVFSKKKLKDIGVITIGGIYMFQIKEIKINGDVLNIVDKKNKVYNINLNNSMIASMLPLASNSSNKINKNINYFKKAFIICIIGMIFCICHAFVPVLANKFYAEVFVLGFGGLAIANGSLAICIRLYINWLKKYSINNEYWQEIYHTIKAYINENQFKNSKVKIFQEKNTNNSIDDIKDTFFEPNNQIKNDSVYAYSKRQIIQDDIGPDKVKTYKRY